MKTFHVFIGRRYYPAGFADYSGSFESLELAKESIHLESATNDWAEILETQLDGSLYQVAAADLNWDTGSVTWDYLRRGVNWWRAKVT